MEAKCSPFEHLGAEAAVNIMVFKDTETLTGVLVAICLCSVAMLVAVTLYLARLEHRERLEAAKWAAQTLEPPVFDWRPTRRWVASSRAPASGRCRAAARKLWTSASSWT